MVSASLSVNREESFSPMDDSLAHMKEGGRGEMVCSCGSFGILIGVDVSGSSSE